MKTAFPPSFARSAVSSGAQPPWARRVLLAILAFEAVSALAGGIGLAMSPDGSALQMPRELLHGYFPDFLVPGLCLTGLGVLFTLAFGTLLRRSGLAWLVTGLAVCGLVVWLAVEIVVLGEVVWAHYVWGAPDLVALALALPLIPRPQPATSWPQHPPR